MRIKIKDPLVAGLDPDLAEREIQLTEGEKEILWKARRICEEAAKLQAQINEAEGIREDENSFEWARIYLDEILEDNKIF